MRQPQIYTAWKVTCHSHEESLELQQWLLSRIDLERVITDTLRTAPNGIEQTWTERHRLGDYFESIRILPSADATQASFILVFQKLPDAKRFWKDLMVNILRELDASPQSSAIELEFKGDRELVSA